MNKDINELSVRGRVAYGIICLEETLYFLNLKVADWQILLDALWTYTDIEGLDDWHMLICEYKPTNDFLRDYKDIGYEIIAEDTFLKLKSLYSSIPDEKFNLIEAIVDRIFVTGTVELYGKLVNNGKHSFMAIKELVVIMEKNNISFPKIKNIEILQNRKYDEWGDPFKKSDIEDYLIY